MFTLEQIQEAHKNVKSGADFPRYAHALKALGVERYDTYVADGHSEYFGDHGHYVESEGQFEVQGIEDEGNPQKFSERLEAHQNGETDYLGFMRDAAECGVDMWSVDLNKMTLAYYDIMGNEILAEEIPAQ